MRKRTSVFGVWVLRSSYKLGERDDDRHVLHRPPRSITETRFNPLHYWWRVPRPTAVIVFICALRSVTVYYVFSAGGAAGGRGARRGEGWISPAVGRLCTCSVLGVRFDLGA